MKPAGMYLHIVSLLLVLHTHAQPVSKEAYNRAVDYIACKCTELSYKHPIADTIPPKAYSTKEKPKISKPKPCSWGVSAKGVQEALQATGSPAKMVNLVADLNKEKNHYRPNWTAKDVVKCLTVDVFSNQTRSAPLYQFRERRKGDFMPFQAELQRTLTLELEREAMEGAGNATSRDQQAEKREKVEDKSKDQDVATANPGEKQSQLDLLDRRGEKLSDTVSELRKEIRWHLVTLIFLGLVIIVLILGLHKQVSKRIDALKQGYINTLGRGSYMSERIRDLDVKILGLSNWIRTNVNSPGASKLSPNSETNTSNPESSVTLFYTINPHIDGSFNAASATPEFKTGSSIYLFRKLGETQAEFEIAMREEALQRALKYPKINIDPVCDIISSYNPEATRISIAQKGMAELRGDKWVVTRKAQIRYEI